MKVCMTFLVVSLLSCPAKAVEPSTVTQPAPTIAAATSREIARLVQSTTPPRRSAQPVNPPPPNKRWIGRHPRLFGALVGFGAGCAIGASQVGGSTDNFYNALDEFACPAVGGIGAAAGVIVGSLFK